MSAESPQRPLEAVVDAGLGMFRNLAGVTCKYEIVHSVDGPLCFAFEEMEGPVGALALGAAVGELLASWACHRRCDRLIAECTDHDGHCDAGQCSMFLGHRFRESVLLTLDVQRSDERAGGKT